MSLYGQPKSGKTRFVSTFPKPVLIIGPLTEDGNESIRTTAGVDYAPIENSGEIADLLAGAMERGYNTVAIDTASSLENMILAETLGLVEIPQQRSWGIATIEQWGQVGVQMKTILRVALNLPCNVVIVAHERNFGEDSRVSSELMIPHVTSALTKGTAGWLNGAVDYICQCYKRRQVREVVVKLPSGGQQKKREPTGKVDFCLRVGPHPIYQTGFRHPPEVELPDDIVNPTYAKVAALISGE